MREKRKFQLTPAGEFFYRNCVLILEDFKRLKNETIQINRLSNKSLRIGCLSNYIGKELLAATNDMLAKDPELSLDIVSGSYEELCDSLYQDNLDIIFCDVRNCLSSEYDSYQLIESDCFVAISLNYNLPHPEHVDIADLKEQACILISDKEHEESEKRFYQHAWGLADNFYNASNAEEALLRIMSNKGFLPIDSFFADYSRFGSFIRCVPLYRDEEQIKRSYSVYWKKNKENPYIKEFVDILSAKFYSSTNDYSNQITDFH